jgi:hypothetical protein
MSHQTPNKRKAKKTGTEGDIDFKQITDNESPYSSKVRANGFLGAIAEDSDSISVKSV